ncbi:hypothetical protein DMP23_46695 [Amycolatopsis sp. A1MSW2902]|uniref:hypothetical protein n=1 Tax=Amycolatopsis sp. A1MSW2902 TaxID=687413 RepID=UPI00307EAF89
MPSNEREIRQIKSAVARIAEIRDEYLAEAKKGVDVAHSIGVARGANHALHALHAFTDGKYGEQWAPVESLT